MSPSLLLLEEARVFIVDRAGPRHDGESSADRTRFASHDASFDITPDGKRIVFDRLSEESDIVLIELARQVIRG